MLILMGLFMWGFVGLQGLFGLIMWVVCRVLLWGVFSWFVWVLLVSLSFFLVHLGVLSYTFCIIRWRPL
jgi:hypothetical protein